MNGFIALTALSSVQTRTYPLLAPPGYWSLVSPVGTLTTIRVSDQEMMSFTFSL